MRLALVTGGSKGLGLALVREFHAAGYEVGEFSRSAPHPISVRVDLADPLAAVAEVERVLVEIDPTNVEELVVVNNAGVLGPIGPAAQSDPREVSANLNANVVGPVLVLGRILRHFAATPGRKILAQISSGAALRAFSGWSAYCASKAALEHFVRTVAVEQARLPHPFVAVNVDPGVIDTDMQALIRAATVDDFPDVVRFVRRKEEGQLADPVEVARAVLRIVRSPRLVSGERYDVTDFARD